MKNEFIVANGVATITLEPGVATTIDVEDLPLVIRYTWYASKLLGRSTRIYARARVNGRTTGMHQLLIPGVIKPFEIDHIDRDGLNNRRGNLRVVTHSKNLHNRGGANKNSTTGVLGVALQQTQAGPRYYANVQKDHKTRRKVFPATPEGLVAAEQYITALRAGDDVTAGQLPRDRLTTADVLAIRDSSASNAELAEQYNVSHVTIWRTRTGRNWK